MLGELGGKFIGTADFCILAALIVLLNGGGHFLADVGEHIVSAHFRGQVANHLCPQFGIDLPVWRQFIFRCALQLCRAAAAAAYTSTSGGCHSTISKGLGLRQGDAGLQQEKSGTGIEV